MNSSSCGQVFSTSYTQRDDGGLRFVVATPEHGQVFLMDLDPQEALNNLVAFADTLGYVVTTS